MATYDQEGRRLGASDDTRSFGASVWEFFHPAQVQAEARAVGAPVPTYGEVWRGAAADATTAAAEAEANLTQNVATLAAAGGRLLELLLVGAVIAGALTLVRQVGRRR